MGGWPREVHTLSDGSGIIIGVGGADADAVNLADGFVGVHQFGKFCVEFVNVSLDGRMLASFNRTAGQHDAARVDNAKHCVGATYVDSDYVGFAHFFQL